MKVSTESLLGRIVLLFGHVAGMLDLVILPFWVGGMMTTHHLEPQEAGGVVTLFLVGVLASNGVLARMFGRLPNRAVVVAGYCVAALAFFGLTYVPFAIAATPLVQLGALNLVAGLGIGAGLSCVHGTIARSVNPHRTFAIVNLGVGIFAVLFFALTPPLMATIGVNAVFYAVLGLILCAIVSSALAFPTPPGTQAARAAPSTSTTNAAAQVAAALAIGFVGVVLLQTAQAITNSFAERVGAFRGFSAEAVGVMFAVNGFISLCSPILAGLLEKKLVAAPVAVAVLLIHGLCSITLTSTASFWLYSAGFITMIFVTIFGHTFIFGLFARFDPTGRINASTPSMLMLGTAIGPVVGGVVLQRWGFPAMGLTSAAVAFAGAACFAAIAWRTRGIALPARAPA
jgi:predicted MFS family arabinose efflux permease